jgi:hypothetical protein
MGGSAVTLNHIPTLVETVGFRFRFSCRTPAADHAVGVVPVDVLDGYNAARALRTPHSASSIQISEIRV